MQASAAHTALAPNNERAAAEQPPHHEEQKRLDNFAREDLRPRHDRDEGRSHARQSALSASVIRESLLELVASDPEPSCDAWRRKFFLEVVTGAISGRAGSIGMVHAAFAQRHVSRLRYGIWLQDMATINP